MSNFPSRPRIEELVGKLEEIQFELQKNLANLQEKLALLESPQLQDTLASYRKDAEDRANTLEAEVARLREELKSIKDLLGLNLQKSNFKKL